MTAKRIDRPCEQGPRARWDSGPRRAADVRLVVIHSAESTSARGVAGYFATVPRAGGASTQLAIDNVRCVRMLPDLVVPWGAPGVNRHGVHVELCGYACWTRADWQRRAHLLGVAAYKVARWCWQYEIPARWVEHHELRARGDYVRGITTHRAASRAYPAIGSGHTDPGDGFPYAPFLRAVREQLDALERGAR